MRVLVTIEPRDATQWKVHAEWNGPQGASTADTTPVRLAHPPYIDRPESTDAAEAIVLAGEMDKLRDGEPAGDGAPENTGRFLMACLFAPADWGRIVDAAAGQLLEVALSCDGEASVLHGLPWELMHIEGQYVALLPGRPIVVTRLVRSAEEVEPTPVEAPPVVLFAVGSRLTDASVRAGAEFMALMREVGGQDNGMGGMETHVVEHASLQALDEAVRRVRPDIVYLVSHGKAGVGGTVLQMRADDSDADVEADGRQILKALRGAGRLPAVVIVSACDTARTPEGREAPFSPSVYNTSFAAQLVESGVPVVVAMSGRVTDHACRVFMRQFASGLLCGKPLVDSVAAGRRAAFRGEPPSAQTADWALPCVVLAHAVPERFAPIDGVRERTAASVAEALGLVSPTVFCGRREFFETYARIVRAPGGLEVLVVHTADESGLGRHRLLKELAAQALRDGHVPFVVEAREDEGGAIVSPRDFAIRVLLRVRHLRELLGLGPPATSRILHELGSPLPPRSEDADDNRSAFTLAISAARERKNEVPLANLKLGIARDVHAVVTEAVAAGWPGMGPHSRPLVLLRRIDAWPPDAMFAFRQGLITEEGLGIVNASVPVIATWRDGAAGNVKPWEEQVGKAGWITFAPVGFFTSEDDEDVLAFTWTMLQKPPSFEAFYAVREHDGEWLRLARKVTNGRPADLEDFKLELCAMHGVGRGEVVRGDDVAWLEAYAMRDLEP